MQTVLTRKVSPSIEQCQLTFMERQKIDYCLACKQHENYERLLSDLGYHVISLQPQPLLPDSVFVEDCALVLDEIALVAAPARESRRGEIDTVAEALAQYKPLAFLHGTGSLEGGDIIQDGHILYVGVSTRTNMEGALHLRKIVSRYGYQVRTVTVSGCLHLSTAASCLAKGVILANPDWIDTTSFENCEVIPIVPSEPWAANVLVLNEMIVAPEACPRTSAMLRRLGFNIYVLDISEFQKAEAGITCMSLIFDTELPRPS